MKKYANLFMLALIVLAWGAAKYRVQVLEGRQGEKSGDLHLFAMSDYFPTEVLESFTKATGCKVHYDTFSSNEELLAKLQAGATGYDVIVPSDYMIPPMIREGYIQKLSKEKIPNLKYLFPKFTQLSFDPGPTYIVPYTWGTTGILYNTKLVKTPIKKWADLFDPALAKHISLLDDEKEVLSAMLYIERHSPNTQDRNELVSAQKLLVKLKPSVRLFASDPKQHLLSHNIWAAHIYSGDAEQVIKTNPEFKYVLPEEGVLGWVDNLAIPTDAPNLECAHSFLNNLLQPDVALKVTEALRYASPNSSLETMEIDRSLKPSFLERLPASRIEFLTELGKTAELWSQLWAEAKSH